MNFLFFRENNLILSLILLPAISSFLSFFIVKPRFLREGILLVNSLVFLIISCAILRLKAETIPLLKLMNYSDSLKIIFIIEPIGAIFLSLVGILWFLATIYSIGYLSSDSDKKQSTFFGFLSLSIMFTVMIAVSGNLLTLFSAYELLSLGTYPLIIYSQSSKSYQAGQKYLTYLFVTSTFLLFPAIILLHSFNDNLIFNQIQVFLSLPSNFVTTIIIFCLFFGVAKTAIFPLHNWLPEAMVAPTPVSALLHAVTVVKAGVFTLVKILVFVFGIETINEFVGKMALGGNLFTYITAISVLYSSLQANKQDNIKKMLAYSTIAQLSICLLTLSIFTQTSVIACILHVVTHAFTKITLFFVAGIIYVKYNKNTISECNLLHKYNKIISIIFTIAGLSLIGLPPFFGFWSKYYIILAAWETHNLIVIITILFSTILTAQYIISVFYRFFWTDEKKEFNQNKLSLKDNIYLYFPASITAIICIVGMVLIPFIIDFLEKNIHW